MIRCYPERGLQIDACDDARVAPDDNGRGSVASVSLPLGESARSASILVVDDEPDVTDLFRQSFRREARQGTYVMHFATSGAEALDRLAEKIQPTRSRGSL